MRELKNNKYNIKDGLDFYYSSPVDNQSTLAAYLRKKEFPFPAFSRESGMNQEFSIFAYPTFVLIDSEGMVTQVLAGFDEAVKEVLLAK